MKTLLLLLLPALSACAAPAVRSSTAPLTRPVARPLDARDERELAGRIAAAPRRAVTDPIEVAVFAVAAAPDLAAEVDPAALHALFVKELARDAVLHVSTVEVERLPADGRIEEGALRAREKGAPEPDVWVWAVAMPGPPAGAARGIAIEVETFLGNGDAAKGFYRAMGTVPGSAAAVLDAAEETRHAIVSHIGPTLPSRGAVAGIRLELASRPRTVPAPPSAPGGMVDGSRAPKPEEWKHDCTTQQ